MIRLSWSFTRAVRIPLLAALLLLAYGGVARAVSAPANLIFVDNNSDTSGGQCTANPNDCSLRSAIEHANLNPPGSVIEFGGDYNIVLTSGLPPITTNGTGIYGQSNIITIDANNTGHVFGIGANDVQIDSLIMYGSSTGLSQIDIYGSAVRVKISNNVIGTDSRGGLCNLSPNTYGGIYVSSTLGSLGAGDSRAWIYGNDIECNTGSPGEGISLYGTDHVMIGEDAAHTAVSNDITRNKSGISILNNSASNTVRNSYIHQNNGNGILINNSALNIVQKSQIYQQTNGGNGVWIDGGSALNVIGSPLGGPTTAGNLISGNAGDGVDISDAGTAFNKVYGNLIGTNAAGTAAFANSASGVVVNNGAHDNTIGGTSAERNIISGNMGIGVLIQTTAHDNSVRGNYIGTNISGTLALPNQNGVELYTGAYGNTVGGTIANRNLIGGNFGAGIRIDGSNTATNTVTNNDIGSSTSTQSIWPNGGDNIDLANGTHANVIGGLSGANFISWAGGSGIKVTSGANGNQILLNFVAENGKYGILFDGLNTTDNLISETVSETNGTTCTGCDGIGESNGAHLNVWTEISTYSNAGLGIDKFISDDTTNIVNPPNLRITSVNTSSGVVQGIASPSGGSTTKVELYHMNLDPSGYGEGIEFVGSDLTDGSGHWSITDPAHARCYTAFTTFTVSGSGTSSEFSRSNCSLSLPLIHR